MSIAEFPRKMTADELLALPDDGVERWLIRGELRENPETDMNRRNPDHSGTMFNVAGLVAAWLRTQSQPHGKAYAGDVSFKLQRDRETLVGIDVAYISAELVAKTPKGCKVVDGVPILAVEIVSPSDVHSNMAEKVREYLDVGVALVWVIDPDFEMVTVFQRDHEPVSFNKQHELNGDPHLPGLRVKVAELFQ